MPHLHLPIDHTDDDLVLAANVADVVGSADLYVAWSHEGGPGAVPEVQAVLREERPASLFTAIGGVFKALWRALFNHPAHGGARLAAEPHRATEPSA